MNTDGHNAADAAATWGKREQLQVSVGEVSSFNKQGIENWVLNI
jgi:hypothetical protein